MYAPRCTVVVARNARRLCTADPTARVGRGGKIPATRRKCASATRAGPRQTRTVSRIHEHCAACGFDGAAYADPELLESFRSLGQPLGRATRRCRPAPSTRPAPTTWSAIEYAAHSRDVTRLHAHGLEQALTRHEPTFPPISDDVVNDTAYVCRRRPCRGL